MAKQDVPPGFQYDPKTRGAFNPTTGEVLSRKAVETPRIAREMGFQVTTSIYERKAGKRKAEGLAPLPRRLKVHYAGYSNQRIELIGQTRYKAVSLSHTVQIVAVIAARYPNAEVYIKAYGRSVQDKYRGRYGRQWVALTSFFRAAGIQQELPAIAAADKELRLGTVTRYDVIVRRTAP